MNSAGFKGRAHPGSRILMLVPSMSILLLITITLCSMNQKKCYFGRSETIVKQYQGGAKTHLDAGYVFPGGKNSQRFKRIHGRLCKEYNYALKEEFTQKYKE